MRLRHAALLLAVSAVLPGCNQLGSDFCTLEARSSVTVTVMDTRGTPQRDARVTFTLNGGPEQQAQCVENLEGSTGTCGRWVTVYEQPGQFVITATSPDGKRTAQRQVVVGEDECHVHSELVQLTLPD